MLRPIGRSRHYGSLPCFRPRSILCFIKHRDVKRITPLFSYDFGRDPCVDRSRIARSCHGRVGLDAGPGRQHEPRSCRCTVTRADSGRWGRMNRPALIATRELTKNYGKFVGSAQAEPGDPAGGGLWPARSQRLGEDHDASGFSWACFVPLRATATISGLDCWRQSLRVRRLVSYLPGELRIYGSMSGLAALRFLSDLREGDGLDRAVALAERMMGLEPQEEGPRLLDGDEAEAGPGAGVRRPGRYPDPRRAHLLAGPLGPRPGAAAW